MDNQNGQTKKRHKRLQSFGTKLRLSYFAVIFMPIFIIGLILISFRVKQQKRYDEDLISSYNKSLSQGIYEVVSQLQTISDSIVYIDELMEFLSGEYENDTEMRLAASKIQLLDDYVSKYAGVADIGVYVDRPDMIEFSQLHKVTDEVRSSDWYNIALSQYRTYWFTYFYENKYKTQDVWSITLVRRMVLVGSDKPAVIMIKLSNDYLRSRFQNTNYLIQLSVDRGVIGYSSSMAYIGESPEFPLTYDDEFYSYLGESMFNGEKTLTSVNTLKFGRSSNLLYLITYDLNAKSKLNNIIVTSLAIFLIALLLPLIFMFFFSGRFASEVGDLRNEMGKASRGKYDEMTDELTSSRELNEAFDDLKSMVTNIQKMEADHYEKVLLEQNLEIREKNVKFEQQKMEFRMLSNQINPHFLYNTLETIRMKAISAGDREVGNAIKLLGKSMRYVLDNTGTADTTLAKELEHINIYLQIQKLRFSDRLNYSIIRADDIEPEHVKMLPLLIQPIAENAIIHGLELQTAGGFLELKAQKHDEELVITVKDNGCGIEESRLKALNENLANSEGDIPTESIGVVNINRRIKLNYGEEYGVKVESEQGVGTCVTIRIPYILDN